MTTIHKTLNEIVTLLSVATTGRSPAEACGGLDAEQALSQARDRLACLESERPGADIAIWDSMVQPQLDAIRSLLRFFTRIAAPGVCDFGHVEPPNGPFVFSHLTAHKAGPPPEFVNALRWAALQSLVTRLAPINEKLRLACRRPK